jgi:hypothetical protein
MVAQGAVAGEQAGAGQSAPGTTVTRECDGSDTMESVRPRDATADQLLQFGAERSPTFRALVEDLRLSDVIVYVQVQQDPESARAGSLHFIGSGGRFRWVMATVETGSSRLGAVQENLVTLTAILGHELQHAREVSAAPSIRTAADFEAHFRTVGIGVSRNAVDTEAARHIGRLVEGEIRGLLKKAL